MNKCKFWNYIISFVKERILDFDESFLDISSQQLRALFTSYCLMFDINTYTAESDVCLWDIFNETGLSDLYDVKENFDKFMLEYLV